MLPKILLLFCGGTISMSKNEQGALESAHDASQFFELEPRIKTIADISVKLVANIDSTDADPRVWEMIVDAIQENYEKYDGFLVTYGTNTMSYAASAVSFALAGIGKPVVFTGAQIPAEIISTDAHNNLVNALTVATLDLAGVFVVFGSKIMLGCRSKKLSESELDAFGTFNEGDFGEICIGIKINKEGYKRHTNPLVVKNGFDDDILCYTLIPGMQADFIITAIDHGVRGIVLRSYGSGDTSAYLFPALEYAQKKGVPVVVTTQCRGTTVVGLNSVGLESLKYGIIQAYDMSMETMSTKLMWALKQGFSYEEIKTIMHTNMCGELSTKNANLFLNQLQRK